MAIKQRFLTTVKVNGLSVGLTPIQLRAFNKITDEWQNAKQLDETLPTLEKLKDLKLVERSYIPLEVVNYDSNSRDETYFRRRPR